MHVKIIGQIENINGKRIFVDINGNPVFADANGKEVRPEAAICDKYNFRAEDKPKMIIVIDDGKHKEEENFNIETLRGIVSRKIAGYVSTLGGLKAKIYDANLNGEFPIIGAHPEKTGEIMRWNSEGKAECGDDRLSLLCYTKIAKEKKVEE